MIRTALILILLVSLILPRPIWGQDKPPESADEVKSLIQKTDQLFKAGRYEEAIPYAEKLFQIYEQVLGEGDLNIEPILNILATLYYNAGRHSEGVALLMRWSEKEEKSTDQKIKQLIDEGRYDEAISHAKKSLEVKERMFGKEHPTLARNLGSLALLYDKTGRYAEAELLYKRSLEIREKTLGKDHPNVATSLNSLAELYRTTGRYAEAEPLFKRSLDISEKALGRDNPAVATILINLAELYGIVGRYEEAEPLYKKLLEIRERVLGKDHPDVAIGLQFLGLFYYTAGRYGEAEPLLIKSLEMMEKVLGKKHPDEATIIGTLGSLYQAAGKYGEAELLLKRSLEIYEKTLGKDHPKVATILNNLAALYQTTGRYAEAEPLFKKSLEIREKALGKDHPDVATSLTSLAALYQTTGRYAEAEPLSKRSLEIREKALGKDHPDVATSLTSLAELYQTTGRYAQAEPLFKRSLEIREKALGKDHPDVATSLTSLAAIYQTTGRYAEAEPLYKRSLGIFEKVLGKDHPSVATILNSLAELYAGIGKHGDSHQIFNRGIEIEEKKRENVFLLLSEKQKITYTEQTKGNINALVSHTAQYLRNDNLLLGQTFNTWLRWKGAVLEAQGRYIDAVTYSEDSEVRKKFDELNNIRREIAKLHLSKLEKMSLEEYRKMLEDLEKKKEFLEAELSRLSKDFALEKMVGKVDTKGISKILLKKGDSSVYIDFANIPIFDFKKNKFGKSRYLVFVLISDKEPVVKLLDLSDAGEVDNHIRAYLEEMKRAKEFREMPRDRILKTEAKALYEVLFKPIEADIKGKKHLYVSPDGNLNLIPFEVLINSEGKYLMEDYTLTYIAAGRDIMRFVDTNIAQGDGLIMADPDYDMGLKEKEEVAKALGVIETRSASLISRDAKDLRFKRLPDTKQEAEAVEKCLRESQNINVRNYQDKRALDEVLLMAKNPKFLHLATHGYFLRDEEVKHQPRLGFITQEREQMVDIGMENPMLRSGIVFAGVNASLKEGRDDGVVSAEKILGLRLKGTDLVVLSACETGVGDVKSGEGVFGLKRSFILSGAKTVVMSLWSIPSKETTELMTDFYTLMAKGKTKAEALREARLNLMRKKPNPFYWGAFVMVGNPN
jgi:CHAT domain-containing protein/Flp pilus assembly protein TadD